MNYKVKGSGMKSVDWLGQVKIENQRIESAVVLRKAARSTTNGSPSNPPTLCGVFGNIPAECIPAAADNKFLTTKSDSFY
jgi:hypothetical protein